MLGEEKFSFLFESFSKKSTIQKFKNASCEIIWERGQLCCMPNVALEGVWAVSYSYIFCRSAFL